MHDDAMVIAVRVLTAARRSQQAHHDDVEELLRVLPQCTGLAPDELACEVIQKLIHAIAVHRGGCGRRVLPGIAGNVSFASGHSRLHTSTGAV